MLDRCVAPSWDQGGAQRASCGDCVPATAGHVLRELKVHQLGPGDEAPRPKLPDAPHHDAPAHPPATTQISLFRTVRYTLYIQRKSRKTRNLAMSGEPISLHSCHRIRVTDGQALQPRSSHLGSARMARHIIYTTSLVLAAPQASCTSLSLSLRAGEAWQHRIRPCLGMRPHES